MADLIVCLVLAVVIGVSVCYIIKAKKAGVKCIGCPAGGTCSHAAGGCTGCGTHTDGTHEECRCNHTHTHPK